MIGDPLVYLVLVVVLAVAPGPDVALIVRAASIGGVRGAAPVIGGVFCGLLVHITCSIAGVSAVIAASATALDALRIVGAGWLGLLGALAVREGVRGQVGGTGDAPAAAAPRWRTGFLTNLLNAKILLFYLAFLPQFAPAGDDFVPVAAALAAVQAAVGMAWLFTCAAIAGRLRALLQPGRRSRRLFDGVTGAILLAAAVELLWSALR